MPMLIVRITTRIPSRSVFKADTFRVGYLRVCCGRSFQVVEDVRNASEFASNTEALASLERYGLNLDRCEVGPSPNPPKKKTGFF